MDHRASAKTAAQSTRRPVPHPRTPEATAPSRFLFQVSLPWVGAAWALAGLSLHSCEMGPAPLHTATTQGLWLGMAAEAAARGAAFAKGWIPPGHAQLAFPLVSLGWVAERWHD